MPAAASPPTSSAFADAGDQPAEYVEAVTLNPTYGVSCRAVPCVLPVLAPVCRSRTRVAVASTLTRSSRVLCRCWSSWFQACCGAPLPALYPTGRPGSKPPIYCGARLAPTCRVSDTPMLSDGMPWSRLSVVTCVVCACAPRSADGGVRRTGSRTRLAGRVSPTAWAAKPLCLAREHVPFGGARVASCCTPNVTPCGCAGERCTRGGAVVYTKYHACPHAEPSFNTMCLGATLFVNHPHAEPSLCCALVFTPLVTARTRRVRPAALGGQVCKTTRQCSQATPSTPNQRGLI